MICIFANCERGVVLKALDDERARPVKEARENIVDLAR